MEWIQENWFFILFAAIFVGMHLFDFGCGGHGSHEGHSGDEGHDEHKHSEQDAPGKKGGTSCH